VGAAKLLAQAEEFKNVADAIADCSLVVGTTALGHRELRQPLHRLEEGVRLIRRRLLTSRVALLFGSEKVGLSNRDLSHCHWLMRIPTREEHGSMNLGQAVAVCLYEVIRDGKISYRKENQSPAAAADLERITIMLLEALRVSGFLKPGAASEDKVRRLVRHLNVPAEDARLWLGMLHQILWKLHSPAS
jgi:tRNA/rRNA methyltransferase